ncbi:MAG: hypothetical protein HY044_01215 [Candidatus Woesebacteria bacterium]|nr:MAG: hypothetical protein HY044_01215 [Candidatus Woesebacteria bacterium]
MTKGIIYYTDNRLIEPLFSICQKYILASGLPITSVSLKPINFGKNIVIEGKPGYPTMVNQIIAALEASSVDCVFFCEHDVLYHKSHFDFTPSKEDVYYYNMSNWRWGYPSKKIIKYDGLTSLSQLCANRVLLFNHFKARQKRMKELGFEKFREKDPYLARVWGYEPGRKKRRNGAFLEEKNEEWSSKYPNIDIRHVGTFSSSKVRLNQFIHKPTGWIETTIDKIPGWNLKEVLS